MSEMHRGKTNSLYEPVTASQVCFLVPTKDRPEEVKQFCLGIRDQSVKPGKLLFVDGGESIEQILQEFSDLSIEYHTCYPPSQIRQRNFGISKITDQYQLVACFDDDTVLEEGALEAMLNFYNRSQGRYGAVSFNIVNRRGFRFNFFKYIFLMSGTKPGQVLPSGYNSNLCNVSQSMETDWVFGGATIWRTEVLKEYSRNDWYGSYAFTEDVEMSCSVRKKFPLAICAEAKVRDMCATSGYLKTVDFGRKQVMIRIEFARRTEGMSVALAFWACIGQTLESFVRIFINRDIAYINSVVGNIIGLLETIVGRRYKAN